MRRAICYAEPHFALAGETGTWRFVYQASAALPKGAKLKFDLRSPGRDIDWEQPSVSLRAARNVIWGHLPDGKAIGAKEVETPDSVVPQYEFTLPGELQAGESFVVVLGAPPRKKDPKHGSRVQQVVQRRRQFLLYVDPKGKGDWGEPEAFSFDIRGNVLHHIRVIAPSYAIRNKRFDITIRFEDEFGNLTTLAPEETLIDLTYENLRENLNWKLFVPETGFVILPNLYFNESKRSCKNGAAALPYKQVPPSIPSSSAPSAASICAVAWDRMSYSTRSRSLLSWGSWQPSWASTSP